MFTKFVDAIGRLRKVRQTLGWKSGGIYKRVDENRELMELLDEEAPDFLAAHPWVVSWLKSQDEFLCQLIEDLPVTEALFLPGHPHTASEFPRSWPQVKSA